MLDADVGESAREVVTADGGRTRPGALCDRIFRPEVLIAADALSTALDQFALIGRAASPNRKAGAPFPCHPTCLPSLLVRQGWQNQG